MIVKRLSELHRPERQERTPIPFGGPSTNFAEYLSRLAAKWSRAGLWRTLRQRRFRIHRSLNSTASELITCSDKRIPNETQNKQIPAILSADYKDSKPAENPPPSLTTRYSNLTSRQKFLRRADGRLLLHAIESVLCLRTAALFRRTTQYGPLNSA